jgi:hypothetical protein
VRRWWALHRLEIAEAWNLHRPANCPVGPINVSELNW